MAGVDVVVARPVFPYYFAQRHNLLALEQSDGAVDVFYTEGTQGDALVELERVCAGPFRFTCQESGELSRRLTEAYQEASQQELDVGQLDEGIDPAQLVEQLMDTEDLLNAQDDAPVIRLLNAIMMEAIKRRASDIHIECFEQYMSVRLRIDGVLQEIATPGYKIAPLLISRIKVMARLDIAERRLPQDGRLSLKLAGRELDVRVSTLPSMHGERVVMRLLDKDATQLQLSQLGMPENMVEQLQQLLAQPNGILLVTGPTGAGKTTTLYASLAYLNHRQSNIMTVEDPIEYALDGIGQTQVNARTGMTFARGLRAILRQDPDVVMVGEIRDSETAQIAVQASLTGHLVLSTLHTNNAVGAVSRLMDIGTEPFLLASTLRAVLAQRLVRKLCTHCRKPAQLSAQDAHRRGVPVLADQPVYQPVGCSQCRGTGYSGRQGIYELLVVDAQIRELIHSQASEQQIMDALASGSKTLLDTGCELVVAGITSLDEVLRTVREEVPSASL